MAFSMEDILLEPFGGDVLKLTVSQTTSLTAALAAGGLIGFGWASYILSKGADPFRMSRFGALLGIPAFLAVISSGFLGEPLIFALGTSLIGFAAGIFGHGTLTATMNLAPENQSGLALGAWGAVQASAAGVAIALGGMIRDLVASRTNSSLIGYSTVYSVEIGLLVMTMIAMWPLIKASKKGQ
jgi:BCD family chlorophyll transporter-like MFS transporter